jgi:hypothetical protein
VSTQRPNVPKQHSVSAKRKRDCVRTCHPRATFEKGTNCALRSTDVNGSTIAKSEKQATNPSAPPSLILFARAEPWGEAAAAPRLSAAQRCVQPIVGQPLKLFSQALLSSWLSLTDECLLRRLIENKRAACGRVHPRHLPGMCGARGG